MQFFLKYFGSKRRVLRHILALIKRPGRDAWGIEPFVGSGSVLLTVRPRKALIWDRNPYLLWLYPNGRQVPPRFRLFNKLLDLNIKYIEPAHNQPQRQALLNIFNNMEMGLEKVLLYYLIQSCSIFPIRLAGDRLTAFVLKYDRQPARIKNLNKLCTIIENICEYAANNIVRVGNEQFNGNLFKKYAFKPDDFVFIDPPYGLIGDPNIKDDVYQVKNDYHWKQTYHFCLRLDALKVPFLHTNTKAVADVYKHRFQIAVLAPANNNLRMFANAEPTIKIDDYAIYNYKLPKERQKRFIFPP